MIKGRGAPDASTLGNVGSLYRDLDTNDIYECIRIIDNASDYGFIDVTQRTPEAKRIWVKYGGASFAPVTEESFDPANLLSTITELTLPSGFTIVQGDFNAYTSLKKVTIPEGVTRLLGESFYGNTTIEEIVLPNSLTYLDTNTFSGCTSLKSIVIPPLVKFIDDYMFCGCTSLENVVLGNSVSHVSYNCFEKCTALKEITIPASVIKITTDSDAAFKDCTNLTKIVINKPKDSIPGAPWGATNATVIWTG